MIQALFDKYFMEQNGLWRERLGEVKEKGFEKASSIARLIYSCEIGSGIDQHASEDLKAVSSYMMAQADELATLRAERDASILQLMDEIEMRLGIHEDRWEELRKILEAAQK